MSKETDAVSEFDACLEELEQFSKAYGATAPPKKKAAAKEEADAEHQEPDGDEDDQEKEMMQKAVEQPGEPGEMDADAFMAQFLAKSKAVVQDALKAGTAEQHKGLVLLSKALVAQGKVMQSMADEITALKTEVAEQGMQPKMRKSAVTVQDRQLTGGNAPHEQPIMAKDILAKCTIAGGLVEKGVLGPVEVSVLQSYANRDLPLPPHMMGLARYANS